MEDIGPKFLEIDGVPAFVILRYEEYRRLLSLAAASRITPGECLTAPCTDSSALLDPGDNLYPPALKDGLIPHDVIAAAVHNHWSLLRAWREYLGLNQLTLAQRLNVSVQKYGEMEDLYAPLHVSKRARLAQCLGIQIEQLVPRRRRLRRASLDSAAE